MTLPEIMVSGYRLREEEDPSVSYIKDQGTPLLKTNHLTIVFTTHNEEPVL